MYKEREDSAYEKRLQRIYSKSRGKYNEGELVGAWFTFPIDEGEVAEKVGLNEHYEEYAIHDYEFPVRISEYITIKELNEMYSMIEEMEDYIIEALDELISCYGDLESVYEHHDDIIFWEYDDMEDIAAEMVDMGYYGTVPQRLQYYIDYSAIARHLKINGTWIRVSTVLWKYRCKRIKKHMEDMRVYLASMDKTETTGELDRRLVSPFLFPVIEQVIERLGSQNIRILDTGELPQAFVNAETIEELNELYRICVNLKDGLYEELDILLKHFSSLKELEENSCRIRYYRGMKFADELAYYLINEYGLHGRIDSIISECIDYRRYAKKYEATHTVLYGIYGIIVIV